MKTQISELRSGTKNQILNKEIDYSQLPPASSHIGHSGSNNYAVREVWEMVTSENPKKIKARIKGIEVELTASWSLSGKSVTYNCPISKEDLEEKFLIEASKKYSPSIAIQNANMIVVSNGKKSFKYICPSLVEIL